MIENTWSRRRRAMGSSRLRDRSVKYAIVLALALFFTTATACGSSENETAETSMPAEADTSTPDDADESAAEDLGTLKVLKVSPNDVSSVALAATFTLDMWEGTGLEVELIQGQADTEAAAFTRGDIDLSIRGGTAQLANIARGVPAKLVSAVRLPTSMYIVASNQSGIESFDDLGKGGFNFGISSFGSSSDEVVQAVVSNYDLEESQYTITPLNDINGILAAFKRGDIDVFAWSAGDAFAIEGEGLGTVLGNSEEFLPPSVSVTFAASDQALESRSAAVTKFFEVYYEAVDIVLNNPDIAYDIYVGEWDYPEPVGEKAVTDELPTLSTDGDIPTENLTNLGNKVIEVFEVDEFDPSEYWTYWKTLE